MQCTALPCMARASLRCGCVTQKIVKPQLRGTVPLRHVLSSALHAGKTRTVPEQTTATKLATMPKLTVPITVWVTEDMKQQLETLLVRRVRETGHRLTLSDLARESFLRLLEEHSVQPAADAVA